MKMLLNKLRLIAIILPLTACLYPPFYPEVGYHQPSYYDGAGAHPHYSPHGGHGYGGGYHDHYRGEGHHGRGYWR